MAFNLPWNWFSLSFNYNSRQFKAWVIDWLTWRKKKTPCNITWWKKGSSRKVTCSDFFDSYQVDIRNKSAKNIKGGLSNWDRQRENAFFWSQVIGKQFKAAENTLASIEFTLTATWTDSIVLYHELRWRHTKDKLRTKNRNAHSTSL